MAASTWARRVVGKWMRPMPRWRVEAMKPQRLATAPPPSETRIEYLSIPIARTLSASWENTSRVLASSPSGTTILWTRYPSLAKPSTKRSPYSASTVSSVNTKCVDEADMLGMISNAACSGCATIPRATRTSVRTGAPVVNWYVVAETWPFPAFPRTSFTAASTRAVRAASLDSISTRRLCRAVRWTSFSRSSDVANAARIASRSRVVFSSSRTFCFASARALFASASSPYRNASASFRMFSSVTSPLAPWIAPSRYEA
mmetsp:Transcript_7970/g.24510  ORF Transcript_7970/g.24510 Transcript_7970/m.24510 type:complete len:259 (+) Transcript_7970:1288-2064(+)